MSRTKPEAGEGIDPARDEDAARLRLAEVDALEREILDAREDIRDMQAAGSWVALTQLRRHVDALETRWRTLHRAKTSGGSFEEKIGALIGAMDKLPWPWVLRVAHVIETRRANEGRPDWRQTNQTQEKSA